VRYPSVRVGDLDIQYELADYTSPCSETPPETFLLYHGYARNMEFWRTWVPLLAGDYRVLRMDARGCGGTTQPEDESTYSFGQLARDAIGLMDALGIDRVHWVGESSGGIVGLTAALNHPDRLKTLTLCDTPFKRSQNIQSTYTLGEGTRAAAFEKFGVGGWCRQTLSYRLDTRRASKALGEWYIREMDKTPVSVANAHPQLIAAGRQCEAGDHPNASRLCCEPRVRLQRQREPLVLTADHLARRADCHGGDFDVAADGGFALDEIEPGRIQFNCHDDVGLFGGTAIGGGKGFHRHGRLGQW